jgi:hypothetical protein
VPSWRLGERKACRTRPSPAGEEVISRANPIISAVSSNAKRSNCLQIFGKYADHSRRISQKLMRSDTLQFQGGRAMVGTTENGRIKKAAGRVSCSFCCGQHSG